MQPCPGRLWDVIPWSQSTTGLTKGFVSLQESHLRLSGGPNECAGNVEIYYLGLWEKVCGHLWDMQDAQVVCRQLGCGFPVAIMYPFPPSDSYSYLFTEMNCAGNEDFLWYCPHEYLHGPCYYGTASVICSGGCLCFGAIFLKKISLDGGGMKAVQPLLRAQGSSRLWVHVPDFRGSINLMFADCSWEIWALGITPAQSRL